MMTFNELYPSLDLDLFDYFNEFRDPNSDLAIGARARFILKGSKPCRYAYVLESKPVKFDENDTPERKQFLKELNQHEFYFIVLFEENNNKSVFVPNETFADLEEARERAVYCLQRYNPEEIEKQHQEVLNSLN